MCVYSFLGGCCSPCCVRGAVYIDAVLKPMVGMGGGYLLYVKLQCGLRKDIDIRVKHHHRMSPSWHALDGQLACEPGN
jgi:hypothetical protein